MQLQVTVPSTKTEVMSWLRNLYEKSALISSDRGSSSDFSFPPMHGESKFDAIDLQDVAYAEMGDDAVLFALARPAPNPALPAPPSRHAQG